MSSGQQWQRQPNIKICISRHGTTVRQVTAPTCWGCQRGSGCAACRRAAQGCASRHHALGAWGCDCVMSRVQGRPHARDAWGCGCCRAPGAWGSRRARGGMGCDCGAGGCASGSARHGAAATCGQPNWRESGRGWRGWLRRRFTCGENGWSTAKPGLQPARCCRDMPCCCAARSAPTRTAGLWAPSRRGAHRAMAGHPGGGGHSSRAVVGRAWWQHKCVSAHGRV